jgi:hypothetical protein
MQANIDQRRSMLWNRKEIDLPLMETLFLFLSNPLLIRLTTDFLMKV